MRSSTKALSAVFTVLTLGLAACGNGNGDGGPNATPTPNPSSTPEPTPLVLNFGSPTSLPLDNGSVPTTAQSLYVGDFTNDDNLDFAILQRNTIGVFVGNGDGSFDPRQDAETSVDANNSIDALAAGEFGQANVELVGAVQNANEFYVYFDANQDGGYGDDQTFAGGNGPSGIAVGDFNGDSRDDIALVGNDGKLYLKLKQQNNLAFDSFDYDSDDKVSNTPRNIVAADFNGDDRDDVAIADFGGDRVTVWLNSASNDPSSFFPSTNASELTLATGSGVQGVTAADLDGDGDVDLIAANPSLDTISVFLNNGNGTFAEGDDYPAGADAFATAVADFNLDGKPDVVVVNAFGLDGTNGDFSVYLGNGDGTLGDPQTFTAGVNAADLPNHPRSVAVGDFNGDGKPDLVLACTQGDAAVVVLNTSTEQ